MLWHRKPGLAAVIVGHDPASQAYVDAKAGWPRIVLESPRNQRLARNPLLSPRRRRLSRTVQSWCLSIRMEAAHCIEAVEEALARYGEPLASIWTTDRGLPPSRRRLFEECGDRHFDGGKGAWRDKFFVERFWGAMKLEEFHLNPLQENLVEARVGTCQYLTFNNGRRPRAAFDRQPPDLVRLQCAGIDDGGGIFGGGEVHCAKRPILLRQTEGPSGSPLRDAAIFMAPDGIAPAMAFLGPLDHILLVDFYAKAGALGNADETIGVVEHLLVGDIV